MNSTVTNLSQLAWSKLDNLSKVRKFIESELDHPHLFSPEIPLEKFQQMLAKIDYFVTVFSQFLLTKRSQRKKPELLEAQFDELSDQYALLMQELEELIRP